MHLHDNCTRRVVQVDLCDIASHGSHALKTAHMNCYQYTLLNQIIHMRSKT